MQRKAADNSVSNRAANENAESAAINSQLSRIIMANAVTDSSGTAHIRLRKLTRFEALRASIHLMALLVSAYFYSAMIKKAART